MSLGRRETINAHRSLIGLIGPLAHEPVLSVVVRALVHAAGHSLPQQLVCHGRRHYPVKQMGWWVLGMSSGLLDAEHLLA